MRAQNHPWILKHTSASAPPVDVASWIQQRLVKLGRIKSEMKP